ncbi:SDR family NAD(P)-dependent oxidoreductase [Frankia sp. CNm7]|uniref:SDR family NAD(P)-dependent oxidoreductase n=1 Tax=Frankia nepalensis TaxID=1836974 RepID=A0A937RPF1_9ACTN|nr:SDR family NAD(P)-dependent oxidoreductase [Frankia nepalensis]MBL7499570.1 SDR family NAD(P)-dependent oxidoreductase [Frankia nepalensis]MBL7513059.1 SDR family NAD(P)-dependent oxidoreductase [Frankia nepalensis]MBL7522895.1 SDR family NAD(P)-dependent oxidoreductase [Frankia nepalensis]MBL7633772.1 SDR family NAD(P)-dependent oxidoreductase [Frankia nepalensis]
MDDYRGQTALITGASSGIGLALAEGFAKRGADVVIAALPNEKLPAAAAWLRRRHPVTVREIGVDLALEEGPDKLAAMVAELGLTIDVLVNNAGFGTHGNYHELDLEQNHREIMLLCAAVERMTHLFLPGMLERGRGTLINVGSVQSFQAVPHMAVYAAAKAFILSFTTALWAEYRGTGVRILTLCPAQTDTDFMDELGFEMNPGGRLRTPEEVVATAFRGLRRGAPYAVDGHRHALTAHLTGVLPRGLVARITERVVHPSRMTKPAKPPRQLPFEDPEPTAA